MARLIRHERDAENIIKIIYVSALGVALTGLAVATGIVDIKDGFKSGRIYSTLQYPNTLAAYLGGVLFLGAYLWHRALDKCKEARGTVHDSLWLKLDRFNLWSYLYACGNFIMLAVLFGTKSRGACWYLEW